MIWVASLTCQGASVGRASGLACAVVRRVRPRFGGARGGRVSDCRAHSATSTVIRSKPPWRLLGCIEAAFFCAGNLNAPASSITTPNPARYIRGRLRRKSVHSRAWTPEGSERRPLFFIAGYVGDCRPMARTTGPVLQFWSAQNLAKERFGAREFFLH